MPIIKYLVIAKKFRKLITKQSFMIKLLYKKFYFKKTVLSFNIK